MQKLQTLFDQIRKLQALQGGLKNEISLMIIFSLKVCA